MEKIRVILRDYHTLRISRKSSGWPYGHTNVYENLQHDLTLIHFIEKHVEPLEAALAEYIASPPPSFLQEWLEYGIHTIRNSLHDETLRCELHRERKDTWPLFFEAEEWEGYEISYEKTRKTVETIRNACHQYTYDDPKIRALHANKKCDCIYMCSYCEKMAEVWKKKMTDIHTHPRNIFLHPEHQAPFLKAWLATHSTYAFLWPPTKIYHHASGYGPYPPVCITNFADMCIYIKETRKKYKQNGKTPIKCYEEICRDLQSLFEGLRLTDSDITLFMKLWDHLDIVPIWIRYEKRRCQEILNML